MRLALILALAFLFASPTESQQGVAPPPSQIAIVDDVLTTGPTSKR